MWVFVTCVARKFERYCHSPTLMEFILIRFRLFALRSQIHRDSCLKSMYTYFLKGNRMMTLTSNFYSKVFSLLVGSLALSIAPAGRAADAPLGANEQLAKALVAKYAALKNAKDASKMTEIYVDSYIENSGRNPSGIAALTQNWQQQFAAMPDLKVVVHDVIASGDKVVARVTYSATHTTPFFGGIAPTGKSLSIGTIDIWRIENGKFAEHWDQVDYLGLQRQMTAKP
jgi:predicted ester cyclase